MKGIETLKALIDGKTLISRAGYKYKLDTLTNKLTCKNETLLISEYMEGKFRESVISFNDVLRTELFIKTNKYFGFSFALNTLKHGSRVSREGWNGKGQYIEMQKPDSNSKMTKPYLYIKTVDGSLVPWLASQTDLLADDWYEVE